MATGKEQRITITASSGLSDAEIDGMVKEAKDHEAEDKKMREEAEIKNRADSAIYQAEKLLSELGDKVSPEEKNKIDGAISRLKEAREKGDANEIRSATEGLEAALNEMSTRLYQQAGAGAQQPPPGGAGPQPPPGGEQPESDVVDADYEIVEDEGESQK
jgi:molecular chaperone DnaK